MKPTINIPPGIIDPFLRSNRVPTIFRLGPGRYYTEGGWAFDKNFDHCVLAPGCELIGSGRGETSLTYTTTASPPNAVQNEVLTAGSRSSYSDSIRIEDLTIDVSWSKLPTVAVHVWSYDVTVRNVDIVGVLGIRGVGEGFGLLVNQPKTLDPGYLPGANVSNVAISTGKPAGENYVCGLYVGYASGEHLSLVSGCRVTAPSTAHAALAANRCVMFHGCHVAGQWNHAWFCDTGGGSRVRLTACDLSAQYAALVIRAAEDWDRILISDSFVTLVPGGSADHVAGLVIEDRNPDRMTARFEDVRMQGCVLTNRSGKPAYLGSLNATRVSRCGGPAAPGFRPPVIASDLNPQPVWEES